MCDKFVGMLASHFLSYCIVFLISQSLTLHISVVHTLQSQGEPSGSHEASAVGKPIQSPSLDHTMLLSFMNEFP